MPPDCNHKQKLRTLKDKASQQQPENQWFKHSFGLLYKKTQCVPDSQTLHHSLVTLIYPLWT